MQDGRKAVWSIPYVSVAFFTSLKQNFIAYRSSKVSLRLDCIFEIRWLWQSGFSRVYYICCCSCWFEAEIIKIGQSSHNMYSDNIVNFQESSTILNVCSKKSGNLLNAPHTHTHTHTHTYIYIYIYKLKLVFIDEGDPKAPFSLATTLSCREGCYSFPWIAPLYPWSIPYNAECKARRHQVPFLSLWYDTTWY